MLYPFFNTIEPPRIDVSPALDCVLRVAFDSSSDGSDFPTISLSEDDALHWALDLGIAGIFAERAAKLRFAIAGSSCSNSELEAVQRETLRQQAEVGSLLERLQHVATDAGVDLALLDGFAGVRPNQIAHSLGGPGVFVLARREDLPKLTEGLIASGFSAESRVVSSRLITEHGSDAADARRELAWSFTTSDGATLCLQHELPFVRMVPGGVFVDLACLRRCGLLEPVAVTHGYGVWRPSAAVRAAYATAQALIEYRFAPEFSFLSALRGTALLGLCNDEDLAFDTYLLLQSDIEHAEFQAWRELMRGLKVGRLQDLSSRARALLDHALAAARVPRYRLRLFAQRRAQKWQQEGGTELLADGLEKVLRVVRRRT